MLYLHGCHGPVAIMAVIAPVPQVCRATTRATVRSSDRLMLATKRYGVPHKYRLYWNSPFHPVRWWRQNK